MRTALYPLCLSLSLAAIAASGPVVFKAGMEPQEPPIMADGFEAIVIPGAPVSNAGPDRNVAVGDPQVLDGSSSSDPGGAPLRYRWVLKSRPAGSQAELRDANTAHPALVPDVAGAYWLELTVNNGVMDSLPDAIRVRAFANFGVDSDGDGLGDALERSLGLNPYEEDSFGDGIRDADRDLDNDGLTIRQELIYGLDPIRADSDGDGVLDGDEDWDEDGLILRREVLAGTSPFRADTDEDGFSDLEEVDVGSNPLDPASIPWPFVTTETRSTYVLLRVGGGLLQGEEVNVTTTPQTRGHLLLLDAGPLGIDQTNTAITLPSRGNLLLLDGAALGTDQLNTQVAVPPATLRRQP